MQRDINDHFIICFIVYGAWHSLYKYIHVGPVFGTAGWLLVLVSDVILHPVVSDSAFHFIYLRILRISWHHFVTPETNVSRIIKRPMIICQTHLTMEKLLWRWAQIIISVFAFSTIIAPLRNVTFKWHSVQNQIWYRSWTIIVVL